MMIDDDDEMVILKNPQNLSYDMIFVKILMMNDFDENDNDENDDENDVTLNDYDNHGMEMMNYHDEYVFVSLKLAWVDSFSLTEMCSYHCFHSHSHYHYH